MTKRKGYAFKQGVKANGKAAPLPGKSPGAVRIPPPAEPWVTFIPGNKLHLVDRACRVVSIGDKYNQMPDSLLNEFADHIRLNITLDDEWRNQSVTAEMTAELVAFADKNDAPIVVHCGEGKVRSYAVACWLAQGRDTRRNLWSEHPFCNHEEAIYDPAIFRALMSFE